MTALIFGANGQDGYYLNRLLLENRIDVIGISRTGDFLRVDMTDFVQVKQIIAEHQPAYIFHLAANSTTAHYALFENHDAISTGTINILEAVKQESPHTKVFLSGSGLQFINKSTPIKETDEFWASSAYSVSRIHAVYAARYYRTFGLQIYVGYLFNHESPRRTGRHVSKMIADGVKRIRSGSNEKIEIGDVTVMKEWTYAGDIVNAIFTLVNQDQIYEAVIGSGKAYSIEDYLDKCFTAIGKHWKHHVILKENFKKDYTQLISDPSTILSMGWQPQVSFEELVQMMIKVDR
jgi:GDPmannose 4,6-dehydratase